jgi:hypothetical protein
MAARGWTSQVEPGDALRASTSVTQQAALLRVVARHGEIVYRHGRPPLADAEWAAVLAGSLGRLEDAHPGEADELLVHHAALCLGWLEQMEEGRAAARFADPAPEAR